MDQKRPVIGVVPLYDIQRDSLWMIPGYLDGIAAAGGIPVVLPLTEDEQALGQLANDVDGFLMTGGQDVSPALYGEERLDSCGETLPVRDGMESRLFQLCLERDVPVLGICRGIQLMNVLLGGTLYQDLPSQRPTQTEHHMSPPYDRPVHQVEICKGTPLFDLIQTERMDVNSYHHQAVRDKAPALQTMAVSEDGLIEAVCLPERPFVWAVQWHPELSWRTDEKSRRIFEAFVGRCASERNRCEKNE